MVDIIVDFINWLWNSFLYICVKLANLIIDMINAIIKGVADLGSYAAGLLPDYTVPTPGQMIDQSDFLSALNWIMPVSFFVDCLAMMVAAYATYHLLGPLLRWAKILR